MNREWIKDYDKLMAKLMRERQLAKERRYHQSSRLIEFYKPTIEERKQLEEERLNGWNGWDEHSEPCIEYQVETWDNPYFQLGLKESDFWGD